MFKKWSLITLLILGLSPLVSPESIPLELNFRIFGDGLVEVEYYVEVDPTEVKENLTPGVLNYEFLLILDQDGLPLDYEKINGIIEVHTFGALFINASYYTSDLTSKEGAIWSFTFDAPIPSKIILPKDSTIVFLSSIPINIGSSDGYPFVAMPKGLLEVSYVIEIGDIERVLVKIVEVEEFINSTKSDGIIITEAENLLELAKQSYSKESYLEAEILAGQAEERAVIIIENARKADEYILNAKLEIGRAYNDGRVKGINVAEAFLGEAEEAYVNGDYDLAFSLSEQAIDAAVNLSQRSNPLLILIIGATILISSGYIGIKIYTTRSGERKKMNDTTYITYDLNVIFKENPNLRLDDREVIRYISEQGGEVFANEIRERFDMPRTSAWRMIRRLRESGILNERKVGGQSLISLNEHFRKTDYES